MVGELAKCSESRLVIQRRPKIPVRNKGFKIYPVPLCQSSSAASSIHCKFSPLRAIHYTLIVLTVKGALKADYSWNLRVGYNQSEGLSEGQSYGRLASHTYTLYLFPNEAIVKQS